MILSFHPIIAGDRNLLCAGRLPDEQDLAAIRSADAVILPQGCSEALYRMARNNCRRVFPNMDVRFDYPGKRGQIRLFRRYGIAHPASALFDSIADYHQKGQVPAFPLVLKMDWGGQGDAVFHAPDQSGLTHALNRVSACERSGQYGFLIQQFIACANRSLRVVVVGDQLVSYWRVQPEPDRFGASVAKGAGIDHDGDPGLQAAARRAAICFCKQSGLQLAGFDFIFCEQDHGRLQTPALMLEINYFFGRAGLGGSKGYYRMLQQATVKWLRLQFEH